LSQGAHFICDHRKSLTRLACARGLDACVQREQVSLEGDTVDHFDDLGDFLRRLFDGAHRRDCLADYGPTFGGTSVRLRNRNFGGLAVIGRLAGETDLGADRCGGFLQTGSLLFIS
jgi:hypothetical protein